MEEDLGVGEEAEDVFAAGEDGEPGVEAVDAEGFIEEDDSGAPEEDGHKKRAELSAGCCTVRFGGAGAWNVSSVGFQQSAVRFAVVEQQRQI